MNWSVLTEPQAVLLDLPLVTGTSTSLLLVTGLDRTKIFELGVKLCAQPSKFALLNFGHPLAVFGMLHDWNFLRFPLLVLGGIKKLERSAEMARAYNSK